MAWRYRSLMTTDCENRLWKPWKSKLRFPTVPTATTTNQTVKPSGSKSVNHVPGLKRKPCPACTHHWKTNVQLALLLVFAAALKYFYSTASVNQLRWILAPTTRMVEIVTGDRFQFESHAGYINSNH